MKERIPIVDSNDHVINFLSKHDYAYDAYTRFVAGIIFVGEKILIAQRSSQKQRNMLCFSLSVVGFVHKDEHYRDAIIRKTKDELGIKAKRKPLEKKLMVNGHTAMYLADAGDLMISPNKEQVERVELMGVKELYQLLDRFPYLFSHFSVEALYIYKAQIEQHVFKESNL